MTEPRSLADGIQRMLRESPAIQGLLPDGYHAEVDTTPIREVNVARAHLPVSCCLMTDTTGVNHCTHPPTPIPHAPWVKRTRRRIQSWWLRSRYRLGCWIAGVDLDDDE